jgi:hypothetical protein
MYFVRFLQTAEQQAGGDQVEYRLVCSGELYNRRVETFDWRKSDVTRMLLEKPFTLLVISQPFDTYPQELCARLTVAWVTERGTHGTGTSSVTFLPDEDIVEDACAILTLLSRRLISPVVKTMQRPNAGVPTPSWFQSQVPVPIVDRFRVVAWPRRPLSVMTSTSGQTVKFNEPPPVGVDHEALAAFLAHLGTREKAQDIVYAARQYKTALELIEQRPDTAYLALVSVVETLASIALATYEPEESERIAIKANVARRAREFGLYEAQADQIALEATKGDRWLTRKFVKFCKDYCPVSELSKPDPVFMLPEFLKPVARDFEDCLKNIYSARSKILHVAVPFPPGAGIGTSPMIKVQDLPLDPLGKLEIPPVTWFERVVSVASRRYLLADGTEPFIDLH